MATAATHSSPTPPVFLLFDFIFASSWPWLALLLATIAATLRALRLHLPSLRAHAENASIRATSPLSKSSGIRPYKAETASSSVPLQRRFKQRTGSKSTSSLGKVLLHSRGRLWRRVFSSVLDAETPSSLKRTVSESKISPRHHEFAKRHQKGRHQTADLGLGEIAMPKDGAEPEGMHFRKQSCAKRGFDLLNAEAQPFGWGLKPRYETVDEKNGDLSQRSENEDMDCKEECDPLFPSWARALCGSSQLRWPTTTSACPLVLPLPDFAFEKQFGWDKLLDTKIGIPWRITSSSDSRFQWQGGCSNVVRIWDELPKKLVRQLDLHDRRVLALDTRFQEGLACTGNISGKISMWELERGAYARESADFRQPVLAISMNSDQFGTVAAGCTSFGVWDHRSGPQNVTQNSIPAGIVSGVKSRGSGLCIATSDGNLCMYDLRKPSYGPVVMMSETSDMRQSLPLPEHENSFWEKFAVAGDGADEDRGGADCCDFGMEDGAAKSASWLSRVTMYVRSVTFTP